MSQKPFHHIGRILSPLPHFLPLSFPVIPSLQVSICLPTGDLYLSSQGIDPQNVWRNIGILTAMIPCYLGMAYLFLRSLKKKS